MNQNLRKMEQKTVIKIILTIFIGVGIHALKAQNNKPIFIKANVVGSDVVLFSEDEWSKEILKDKIIFYNGYETLGAVEEFIHQ